MSTRLSVVRRSFGFTLEQLEDRATLAAIVPPAGQRFAVSTDAGGGGIINVYSPGSSLLQSFVAFDGFNGALRVATGDVNRDGIEDTIVGAGLGPSGGHVKVFDGATGGLIAAFFIHRLRRWRRCGRRRCQ